MKFNILMIAVGVVLTTLSYLVALSFGVQIDPTITNLFGFQIELGWLEAIAVATSYSCTILFMLQKRVAYYYGIVSTFFLCLFFYAGGALALATFNGILVISLLYGLWRWGPDGKKSLPVSRIEGVKSWAGYFAFFGIIVAAFSAIIGTNSKMDIGLASGSATAQVMLDNKKIENWIVWIIVNVFSIIYYIKMGWFLMAIQFVFFLMNAVFALYKWDILAFYELKKKSEGVVENAV